MILQILISLGLGIFCILLEAPLLLIFGIPAMVTGIFTKNKKIAFWLLGIGDVFVTLLTLNIYSWLLVWAKVERPLSGWAIGIFMFLYIWNDFQRSLNTTDEERQTRNMYFWATIVGSGLFILQILFF